MLARYTVGILLLVIAAGAGWAADPDGRPVPRLVCPEPAYSFGSLINTQEVVHEFVIRNGGDASLKINKVRMSCGCMLLRLMNDNIEPGAQTILRARFSLRGLSGAQRKRILLLSNDPLRPRVTLQLTGEAIAELEIRPRQLFWGNLREDATEEKTIKVRFHKGEDYHLMGARSSSALFAAELEAGEGEPTGRIKVRALPPLPSGSFQVNLTILTDHPRFGTVTIPMSGRVIGDLYAIPDEIVLAPSNQPVARAIMIYASRKQKFSVLRVDAPSTNIQVKIRSRMFSGYRVELKNIVPDPALDGKRIVITTDYAPLKELVVPLRIRQPE